MNSIKDQDTGTRGFVSWNDSKFQSALQNSKVLLAEEVEIQGFALYRIIPDGYEVLLLGTEPRFQKMGVMSRILKVLLSLLQKGQILWLEVHEKNESALKLYKKLGFTVTGKRPHYYPDGCSCLNLEYQS